MKMPKKRKKGVAERNRKKIERSKKTVKKTAVRRKTKETLQIKALPKAIPLPFKTSIPFKKTKEGIKEDIRKLMPKRHKIRKGWFAERGEHALAAKGIEVRKKELLRYKYRYSAFIFISLILAIASLIKDDLFSCILGILIMFLSLVFYMGAVEKDERRSVIYISVWPFALAIAIASIFKRNFLSFIFAALIMFLSSFTLMVIKSKTRKESIIKIVRELQKERKKTETDFDKLLILLGELKRLKISEIAEAFNIEKKKANEWARIMEENNLAFFHYPAFGEEELRKK